MVGRRQDIELGPLSGASNVRFLLQERGIRGNPSLVGAIVAIAKEQSAVLEVDKVDSLLESGGREDEPAEAV
jgi:2-isopropylmalate synthase